jgi:hypothetical protein
MNPINQLGSSVSMRAGGVDRAMAQLSALGDSADPTRAAEMFEVHLATMLAKEARSSLGDGGFFGKGPGSDIFNGWLDKHVGEALADGWDLDLAGMVRTSIIEKQGGSN